MVAVAPPNLPTDRGNGTLTFNDHAANHNVSNTTVNQLVASFNDHLIDGNPHQQYLTESEGDGRYLPKGYAPDLTGYYTKIEADQRFITDAELATAQSSYYTKSESDGRYRLSSTPVADSALRLYVQQIMAVLDPGGPPPPP